MHVTMRGGGDIDAVAARVSGDVLASGLSCELTARAEREIAGGKVIVMVFEKYFMRASNQASLTVVLVSQGDSITADVVGAGGAQGAILKFSWGVEESFARPAIQALESFGIV